LSGIYLYITKCLSEDITTFYEKAIIIFRPFPDKFIFLAYIGRQSDGE